MSTMCSSRALTSLFPETLASDLLRANGAGRGGAMHESWYLADIC